MYGTQHSVNMCTGVPKTVTIFMTVLPKAISQVTWQASICFYSTAINLLNTYSVLSTKGKVVPRKNIKYRSMIPI